MKYNSNISQFVGLAFGTIIGIYLLLDTGVVEAIGVIILVFTWIFAMNIANQTIKK